MTVTDAVAELLALGDPAQHPAGAVLGVRTAAGTELAAGGWARLPEPSAPVTPGAPATPSALATPDTPVVQPAVAAAGSPMTPQTRLDLASVTKVAVTTTLAMRLVAEGLLALETPVRNHLPAFHGGGKDEVTVEQLLTHTAGLTPWWPLYLETTERDAAILRAAGLPLASAPGSAWRYSDLGLILAGRVVELVTGLGLAAAFRQLVAEPLGLGAGYGPIPAELAATSADSDAYEYAMVASGVPYPVPFTPARFSGWRDHPLRGEVNDGNAAHALGGVSGHAGLFATAEELLILGAALRGGDFVPRAVLERFAAPSPVEPGQAVGFRRSTQPTDAGELTLLSHSGFTGTWFALGLERELVVAGGATRLHGTVGRLPGGAAGAGGASTAADTGAGGPAAGPATTPPTPPALVTGPQIHEVMLRAGLDALDSPAPTTSRTLPEAR